MYDGSFCRELGTAGGVEVPWVGKAGLVAATTEVIDDHHETIAAPWATASASIASRRPHRLTASPSAAGSALAPTPSCPGPLGRGRRHLPGPVRRPGGEGQRRRRGGRPHGGGGPHHQGAYSPCPRPALRPGDSQAQAEEPTRLFGLSALLEGLRLIGVGSDAAWRHVIDCAFASMPQERCRIMDALVGLPGALTRAQVVEAAAGAGERR